ncbi:siderophore-interacting protein [Streptomyces somaliensis DSM 40738]|uniref:Siderophore-interacting protein n=1 Tax=Streptomyces somaliensis (strain ATCC 33201 / DSM 40738 / JCM 12659 / KCTC 9044 / NCTC 11332 / NRRL B-12077 / IP 733) TaxID=1134445 RepID=A0AA44IFA0_STRE0|nr:siderophore-interacting protein [Streptomyces somaliensis DSM 40738]
MVRTERIAPHMVRIVLGGETLDSFATSGLTDHYVKILFPPEGVAYPEPFDLERIREELPRDRWPAQRTYTVRAWDPVARELTIDFVVHGDEGLAGPWAARARVGETVRFLGPGGGYAPDPEADWHLLAGDESALPAIAAALEGLPDGAVAHAFIEVGEAEDELKIDAPAGAEVHWLPRRGRPVGEALVEAVRNLEFPEGTVHAFVHGEAGAVRELRRYLRGDRGVPLERLSISGYWRLGKSDEAWRAVKREWNAEVEREERLS